MTSASCCSPASATAATDRGEDLHAEVLKRSVRSSSEISAPLYQWLMVTSTETSSTASYMIDAPGEAWFGRPGDGHAERDRAAARARVLAGRDAADGRGQDELAPKQLDCEPADRCGGEETHVFPFCSDARKTHAGRTASRRAVLRVPASRPG